MSHCVRLHVEMKESASLAVCSTSEMISDIKSISWDEEKGTIWNVRRGLASPRIQSK